MASLIDDTSAHGNSSPLFLNGGESPLAKLSLTELCQLTHGQIQHHNRKDIMLAVRRVLDEHGQPFSNFEVEGLATLVRYLCDWSTLGRLQERGNWQTTASEVALAEIQMGLFDKALNRVEKALMVRPFDAELMKVRQELSQLVANTPYKLPDLRNGAISITPLNFNHVADFGWQYADRSIGELCNLPQFPSAQHWMHWLHLCQQENNRFLFAVMHEEYGFIGSVSLQVFNNIGFFYYWLGTDFHGLGLGPKAVEILMRIGKQYLNMNCCFAKVFDYNKPSHKAISKLGFERLPFKAQAPSEAEVFYYLGQEKNGRDLHKQLAWLLDEMRSGIVLEADSVGLKISEQA